MLQLESKVMCANICNLCISQVMLLQLDFQQQNKESCSSKTMTFSKSIAEPPVCQQLGITATAAAFIRQHQALHGSAYTR